MTMQTERTVHSRVAKASDIEIHTSTLVTPSGTYTDIREFVVSMEQYGRGITFPHDLLAEEGGVLDGLHLADNQAHKAAVDG